MRKFGIAILAYLFALIVIVMFMYSNTVMVSSADPLSPQQLATSLRFLPIVFGLGSLLSFIAWIYSFVHIFRNRALRDIEKIMWVIVVIFLNILGSALYFLIAPLPNSNGTGLSETNTNTA